MRIARYATSSGHHVGVVDDDGLHPLRAPDLATLLRLPLAELRDLLAAAAATPTVDGPVDQLPPVDGRTEVWAAGVTYERSRTARMEESTEQSVYDRVYDAERPELFFKSVAWRVVTTGQAIAVRSDSALSVPEPELGLVVNAFGEVIGYVAVNDMTARSIEGENPLYLPQAKTYAGSCAISPEIVPAWEVPDPTTLKVELTVLRDGADAFHGETSTASLRRTEADLVAVLFRAQAFPDGAVLATGTGIVPDLDFTLRPGDTVDVTVHGIGRLSNPVVDTDTWLRS